ncbi:hypothetical protein [Nocardia niigatensis]|nr:hypothetical protein [Nocardia niigatensis]
MSFHIPHHIPHPDPDTLALLRDVALGALVIASMVVLGLIASMGGTP